MATKQFGIGVVLSVSLIVGLIVIFVRRIFLKGFEEQHLVLSDVFTGLLIFFLMTLFLTVIAKFSKKDKLQDSEDEPK
ncbi:MAG: hypothetical protein ABFD79_17280 [Phycisphaerales bacterium]